MLASLQIATIRITATGPTEVVVSSSIAHTKATVRITAACKLEQAVATVRTRVIAAFAGVSLVPSGDRFTARQCSLAYSIMQY